MRPRKTTTVPPGDGPDLDSYAAAAAAALALADDRIVDPPPDARLTDHERQEALAAADSLRVFAQCTFPINEHQPFVPNWHIDAICEHLEAIEAGQIRFLLITMPPRHMKSLLVSVMYPAWVWIKKPYERFMFGSYSLELSMDLAQKSRDIIKSDWYQARYGHIYQLRADAHKINKFLTTGGGHRLSTSVGAAATGLGGDKVIIDDPHNIVDGESELVMAKTSNWYLKSMYPRLNNQRTGARIVVQQRIKHLDVAGVIIEKGGFTHLDLPAEFISTERCQVYVNKKLFWEDPRTRPGELLWPDHIGEPQILESKINLGPRDYSAQYQQRPLSAEGAMFNRKDWALVDRTDIPDDCDWVRFWDLAATKPEAGRKPDWTVGALVGRSRATGLKFLADIERTQDAPGGVETLIARTARRDGRLVPIRYEEEGGASGKFTTMHLATMLDGYDFAGVRASTNKQERARPVSGQSAHGQWHLVNADWNETFLAEIEVFPQGNHDDQVDALTGASRYLSEREQRTFLQWSRDHHLVSTDEALAYFGDEVRGEFGTFVPGERWNVGRAIYLDELDSRDGLVLWVTVPPDGRRDRLSDSLLVFGCVRFPASASPKEVFALVDGRERRFADRVVATILTKSTLNFQALAALRYGQAMAVADADPRAGISAIRDALKIAPGVPHPIFKRTMGRPRLYLVVPPDQIQQPTTEEGLLSLRQAIEQYRPERGRGRDAEVDYPALEALRALAAVYFVSPQGRTDREVVEDYVPKGHRAGDPVPEGSEVQWLNTRRLYLADAQRKMREDVDTDVIFGSRRRLHP